MEYEELAIEAQLISVAKETDQAMLKLIMTITQGYFNVDEWGTNPHLCSELKKIFAKVGVLHKICFRSVFFFVSVQLSTGFDKLRDACHNGELADDLRKLLVTPQLEKECGTKLNVKVWIYNISAIKSKYINIGKYTIHVYIVCGTWSWGGGGGGEGCIVFSPEFVRPIHESTALIKILLAPSPYLFLPALEWW